VLGRYDEGDRLGSGIGESECPFVEKKFDGMEELFAELEDDGGEPLDWYMRLGKGTE
jgi:hypothetical protein